MGRAFHKRASLTLAGALALAGCDAATQIAGETVQGEARHLIVAQCQQATEGAGILAGRVADVCQCAADTFMADRDLTPADASRARVEAIVNDCAKRTSPAGTTAPTEVAGG